MIQYVMRMATVEKRYPPRLHHMKFSRKRMRSHLLFGPQNGGARRPTHTAPTAAMKAYSRVVPIASCMAKLSGVADRSVATVAWKSGLAMYTMQAYHTTTPGGLSAVSHGKVGGEGGAGAGARAGGGCCIAGASCFSRDLEERPYTLARTMLAHTMASQST
eukprot:scaffold1951_cov258-Pinguiococcus_pyrenoidosus.AAC.16